MTWMEKLTLYLSYPFVQYALLVGMLIALCSALLGVTLVLRRMSFLGDGLSHAAFGPCLWRRWSTSPTICCWCCP